MNSWNLIYEHIDRVAFSVAGINVHWYGICYALALIVGLFAVNYFVKIDKYPLNRKELDTFFVYAEVGIILGARFGYILIYSPHTMYYLSHPLEIFNPFYNGTFVGISGMSYHGAVAGFIIGSILYAKIHKKSLLLIMDCAAIALPLGYILGRIGNFLNQELIGRETQMPFGILVDGTLVHPSQLYEAFLEGLCVFLVLFFVRHKVKFQGELIGLYMALYSIARFCVEFFREADAQMGYFGGLSMGQILSILTFCGACAFLGAVRKMKIKKLQQ